MLGFVAEAELRTLPRPGKRILRDIEVPLDSDFDDVSDINLVGELGTLFGKVGGRMVVFRSSVLLSKPAV